jgi:CBS-domain-containing membrane protein
MSVIINSIIFFKKQDAWSGKFVTQDGGHDACQFCNRGADVVHVTIQPWKRRKLMRQHHVGDVLVVGDRNDIRIPVGIITNRDLIIEIMVPELDETVITVGDIMAQELVTANGSTGIFEAIQYMRQKAVRCLPIVNEGGGLIGILTNERDFPVPRLRRSFRKRQQGP